MIAALKESWEEWRFSHTDSVSFSTSGGYALQMNGGCDCDVFWSDGGVFAAQVQASTRKALLSGSITRKWTFKVPGLFWNPADKLVLSDGDMSFDLVIVDPALYCTGDQWHLSWSDIEYWADGALYDSYGPGFWTSDSLTPASVPFVGGGCYLAPQQGTTPPFAWDALTYEGRIDASVTGGWKVKQGGVYSNFPVKVVTGNYAVPSGTCTFSPLYATLTGSASDSFHLTGMTRRYGTGTIAGYEAVNSRVFLVPNVLHSVLKVQNNSGDYLEFWQCDGFPEVRRRRIGTITKDLILEDQTNEYDIVCARVLPSKHVVTYAAHPIEEPLAKDCFAPYLRSYRHQKFYQTGECELGVQEGVDWCGVGQTNLALDYNGGAIEDVCCRILNTWCNRWWPYGSYFDLWPVLGMVPGTTDYWPPLREKHAFHNDLPEAEQRRSRLSVVSDPLMSSPIINTTWFGLYGRPPLGVSRLQIDSVTPPASKQLASSSSPSWTTTDCTAAFGAKIVLTPTGGATTIKIEHDIGRFGEDPRQYAKLCRYVNPDWVATNVAAVRVYIEGIDGQQKLLEWVSGDGFTTKDKDYEIWADQGVKFAGTAAQDYGVGFITDQGSDIGPDGISAATLADPERNQSFNLLAGHAAAKLVFEIDVVNPATTVSLEYPVFKFADGDRKSYWIGGSDLSVVWPNGPGLHWGTQRWDDGSGNMLSTPTVRGPGSVTTVVDWLAWKRAYLQGSDPTAGIAAELATLYGDGEIDISGGHEIEEAAKENVAFLLPFRLGQTFRCGLANGLDTPALAVARLAPINPVTWARSGSKQCQHVTLGIEPRYAVTDGTVPVRFLMGTDQWTSSVIPCPLGWQVASHSRAVDNNEAAGVWWKGDTDRFNARGWHALHSVVRTGKETFDDLHSCERRAEGVVYVLATKEAVKLTLVRTALGFADEQWDVVSGDVSSGQVAVTPWGWLHVVYADNSDGFVKLITSHGSESTWSSPVTIAAGTRCAIATDQERGVAWIAVYDGGTWTCYRRSDPNGNFSSVGTIIAGAGDSGAGLEFDYGPISRLVFSYFDGGGNIAYKYSYTEGGTWV